MRRLRLTTAIAVESKFRFTPEVSLVVRTPPRSASSMMVYIKCLHMIALGNGMTMDNRTRHIEIRQRFVTSKAIDGLITIEKIHTDDEVADIFTKPLPRDAFLKK